MTYPLPLKILGVGRYAPRRIVPSSEIEARIGKPEGWIFERQGIRQRHWVDGELASEMGTAAALEALADAGLEPKDLDLILNASGTSEQSIPDGAPLIQRRLGLGDSGIACMTVHTTCLSFIAGLDVASNLLATGRFNRILVVSADITSCGLNFEHPESSTLFGDAAAAVVVTRTPAGEASAIEAARFETYGEGADYTRIRGGGTGQHPNRPDTKPEDNLFHMDGRQVFRMARRHGGEFLEKLRPGLSTGLGDIDWVIPHQASLRALEAHQVYGMPLDRIVMTIETWGNCVAASIPVTLYEAIKSGRLVRGQRALLLGTGAGLSIGGLILRY